jgi:hypothetical protein
LASRNLDDCEPSLVEVFSKVKSIFEATFPRYELRPTCTYRAPAEQLAEYNAGRSRLDGTTRKSKHNLMPARALDFGIFKKNPGGIPAAYIDQLVEAGKFDKDLRASLYWNASQLVQRFGLRSGQDWNDNGLPVIPDPAESLNDPYHMELR